MRGLAISREADAGNQPDYHGPRVQRKTTAVKQTKPRLALSRETLRALDLTRAKGGYLALSVLASQGVDCQLTYHVECDPK